MKNKRGLELSFNMIFSIIVIIAIVVAAGYALVKFIGLQDCTNTALFVNDLQKAVDKAWNEQIVRQTFKGNVPSGIEFVCLGDLSRGINARQYNELGRFEGQDANLFFYPPESSCGQPYYKIEHLNTSKIGFNCFPVTGGSVSIKLEKGVNDALVNVVR